jgi:esterase/lipase superfamily enzyme
MKVPHLQKVLGPLAVCVLLVGCATQEQTASLEGGAGAAAAGYLLCKAMGKSDRDCAANAVAGGGVGAGVYYSYELRLENQQTVIPAAPIPPAPTIPPATDAGRGGITLLFGTNRTPSTGALRPRDAFTNVRGSVSYGLVRVSIPASHKVGTIDRPRTVLGFEFPEDPATHMVILDVSAIDPSTISKIADLFFTGRPGARRAFIFVHGFNVSFADAALRTAQIAVDMDLKEMPVFFSWASKAEEALYTQDENTALQTIPDFKVFLKTYMAESKADQVVLVAHSLGSRIVTQAIVEMVQVEPALAPKLVQLVLAAADLDAAVFKEQIMPVLATQNVPITLYSSTRDKALELSVKIHGGVRAGSGGKSIVFGRGLESVDASAIDTDFLGHSYFADTRPLLTDMALLVENGLPASKRPLLMGRPIQAHPPAYWLFKP